MFEFFNGYEMMHKAWSSIEEVPYCFARLSIQFQGRTALKIVEFDPDWAFPDCNSSLNSPMATKCCTKLEVAKKRCPIVLQSHPLNFKVTRDNISPISTRIERFWTVNTVSIHQWIWNYAQSLTWYRRSALLFFKVIHQISRLHGRKNWRSESNLRLLGRSQLSNPSDLPCSNLSIEFISWEFQVKLVIDKCHRTPLVMSILAQLMACYHQATSHYLSQYWIKSLSPYDITRLQWVKFIAFILLNIGCNLCNICWC